MSDLGTAAVAELLAAGRKSVTNAEKLIDIEGQPHLILAHEVGMHNMSHLMESPPFLKAHIIFHDRDGFTDYLESFSSPSSIGFVGELGAVTVVIDYHNNLRPAWGDHVVELSIPYSQAWCAWKNIFGKSLSQIGFYEFLETRIDDIITPDANEHFADEFLNGIEDFSEVRQVTVKSKQKLSDGSVQLVYNEQQTEQVGQVKIPTEFNIGVAIFEEEEPFAINCKLRYRTKEGSVIFKVDCPRFEEYKLAAVNGLITALKKDVAIPFYRSRLVSMNSR